jgi:A nuclease family of the HNH/ENDO VII superfamily with conserved AHH
MYNLTVDKAHTFFVGDGQWLVHNCSTKLGKNLGNAPGADYQAHHLIPESQVNHPFVQRAQGADWDNDAAYNGIWLPNTKNGIPGNLPAHANHPQYNTFVKEQLDGLESRALAENWTDQRVRQELGQLAINLRGAVANGGSQKLNDTFRR